MSEGLVSRVSRIVSGGFNSLVDAVENAAPETILEQSMREIESAADDVRTELGRVIANKHLANTRLMDTNAKHEELSEKIALAVKENRDDLAEAAIAKQLDIEAQVPVLEHAITEAGEKERELEGYIEALQAKRREMVAEIDTFKESRKSAAAEDASGQAAAASGQTPEGKVRKAENTFDRVMRQTTGLPGGEATGDAASAAKIAELETLSRDNRIKERLAALKSSKGA